MTKLQFSLDHYFLVMPKQIVMRKGWKKRQELFVTINRKGNVEILE